MKITVEQVKQYIREKGGIFKRNIYMMNDEKHISYHVDNKNFYSKEALIEAYKKGAI